MTEVSVRELKAKLTEYLRRAEAGEEIAVTRRGKRVATLQRSRTPSQIQTLEERLADMEARGLIIRGADKFIPAGKPIRLRGKGPTASEMVLEDRR